MLDMTTAPHRARTDFNLDSERPQRSRCEPLPVMDEEDSRRTAYQDAARSLWDFQCRTNMFICAAADPSQRLLRYECVLLASNQAHILNVNTGAALARLHRVTSAAVNRIIRQYQQFLQLPESNGQNRREGRTNKSKARKVSLCAKREEMTSL